MNEKQSTFKIFILGVLVLIGIWIISESPFFFHWWMPFPHQPIRYNKDCKLVYRLHGPGSRDAYELNYEIWSDSYYGQTKCAEKEL